ncbi:IclR family transcriptional regulator [Paenibacillus nasutitermitis]|uniref:Glycerol operon regulatory protein n=1 Tax=Paenibacillus nasutitermitis TaxID=1652958 RepID=A0A917DX84_9BACL|nr:IclR family transcriptional regulator [Paenibacillus nasutitermitis]GGD78757.1 IclR family transcriptional regulator [Paenibacillus nasutitermitis]
MKDSGAQAPTQSVVRALTILSCFSDEQPEVRVSDVAKQLDLTISNVSRLLATMEAMGYVEKDEFSGFYRLGTKIVTLGGIALNNYDIRKQALPELHALEQQLGLGANLAMLKENQIFYLAHVDSHHSPRMYTLIGRSNPLHCTGIGKVLLAHMGSDQLEKALSPDQLFAYTSKTLTSKEQLMEQLHLIRERGYAMEDEELALGRACLAAPVRNRKGDVIAGISISGSLSEIRLEQREQELSRILIEVSDHISMKMGYITMTT